MTIEIDVTKLSKAEVSSILKEMIESNVISKQLLEDILKEESTLSTNRELRISKLIDKHFEEYDEVFKKLA